MSQDRQRELAVLGVELARLARGGGADRLTELLRPLPLAEQATLALGLPPRERLSTLLNAPQPMRLIRSLPDLDFYLTLREVGPEDGLALVGLASAGQLHHLLDLESWRGDRFDADRCGAWVALFLEAGDPTLRRFLRTADDELLVLLFQHWAHAEPVETRDDPDFRGTGFTETGDERGSLAPDGTYRFSPSIPQHTQAIQRLAQMFFTEDPNRYRRTLWATRSELPAEVEELALRWRESRLEEHGFPPREEALGVYAPPVGVREHPRSPGPRDPDALSAPASPLLLPALRDSALGAIGDLPDSARSRFLSELVAVANHLLVADAADTGDPETHRAALAKGMGYVSIALQARGAERSPGLGLALAEVPVLELFREGYGKAVELQARALRLCRDGWLGAHPLARETLDAPLGRQLAALLQPRPLYLEVAAADESPRLRSFQRLSEIGETATALELVEVLGQVLVAGLGLDLAPAIRSGADRTGALPLISTFVLTLLAWHSTRGERRLDPLPADVVADFARRVASRRTAAPDAPARAFEALTADLARALDLSPRQTALWSSFGRAALERLAADCGSLDPGVPIDPRRVKSLRL